MNELEMKQRITDALARFARGSLLENSLGLLNTLGYHSERQVVLTPNTFEGLAALHAPFGALNRDKALVADWLSVDILFQLTGADLQSAAQGRFIFDAVSRVDNQIIESYLFLAIRLKEADYPRSKLADLTREVNKHFAMPVMLLLQHGEQLTFSIINRRLNKREESRDVLEKVTLIKGIRLAEPRRAHVEILFDLALEPLQKEARFQNFVELHHAWQKTLDTAELNKKFYREVSAWYFWAVGRVQFPDAGVPAAEAGQRTATHVIRLITRVIFVWFIKEKGLVPDDLFSPKQLEKILKPSPPAEGLFYKAILQNLFFATLNTEMGAGRRFRGKNANKNGLDAHHGISTVYRYEEAFQDPAAALRLFADIPFLNGGLFECLDKREEKILVDGFSDDPRNQPRVPDDLFFGREDTIDLNAIYGDTRHSHERVRGLIHIFNSYKFTIEENTPLEEEIALDPELLGKVFENLLAAYNPETGTTARKQTGSFYTPREIVNYMVDEALVAYLESALQNPSPSPFPDRPSAAQSAGKGNLLRVEENEPEVRGLGGEDSLNERLRHLLAYNQEPHRFGEAEEQRLIAAIDAVKVLDPACGSGAFPMGVLHKLVFILSKLDPGNQHWKQRQLDKAAEIPDAGVRERAMEDIERSFNENELDYGRKLYLIENCIYGVDIQPIAVQIAKLRFFISLVVEQKTDRAKTNLGIRPLPNLETKFVAANSLIGIERPPEFHEAKKQGPVITVELKAKCEQLLEKFRQYLNMRTPSLREKYLNESILLGKEIDQGLSDLLDWAPIPVEWIFNTAKSVDTLRNALPIVQPQQASKLRIHSFEIKLLEKKLAEVRTALFTARSPSTKRKNRELDRQYRGEIVTLLKTDGWGSDIATKMAGWDPYDQNISSKFFDPEWMFGVSGGFDVVIGNPPYVRADSGEEYVEFRKLLETGKRFQTLWEKWDLYIPFIELGYQLLKPNGITTMIVSDAYCHSKYAQKSQKWFLENSCIRRLDFFSKIQIFEAGVHNITYFFQKRVVSL